MEAAKLSIPGMAKSLEIDSLRATLRAANFGELMSVLLQSEPHQNVTLGTVMHQVVPAFLADQYVLARAVPDRDNAPGTPIGFAFWASVSDVVAARILASGAGPVRLERTDWNSGDIVVILDMVAAPVVGDQIVNKIREKVGADKVITKLVKADDGSLTLVEA